MTGCGIAPVMPAAGAPRQVESRSAPAEPGVTPAGANPADPPGERSRMIG
jgi:hypothetical protein